MKGVLVQGNSALSVVSCMIGSVRFLRGSVRVLLLGLLVPVAACNANAHAGRPETGVHPKYVAGCEIDLNGDGEDKPDLALLIETTRGRELIVLMTTPTGYQTYLLKRTSVAAPVNFGCYYGHQVTESQAVAKNGKPRTFKTPGAYIELGYPEASSVAYFWNGSQFVEVVTSD